MSDHKGVLRSRNAKIQDLGLLTQGALRVKTETVEMFLRQKNNMCRSLEMSEHVKNMLQKVQFL